MFARSAIAVAALFFVSAGFGQSSVSIVESKIQAVLKNQSTVVSVPFQNVLTRDVKAKLSLDWLDRDDTIQGSATREVFIPAGMSAVEVPLPIGNPSIWLRLRYTLTPDIADVRAFARITGIMSIAHIAPHVFEIRTGALEAPKYGQPFTLRAQAIHPITRVPIPGVAWEPTVEIGDKTLKLAKVVNHTEGFAEFIYNLPSVPEDDADDDLDFELAGRLGDFEQEASGSLPLEFRASAKLQTDKPIYQPGQTIHVRAVVQDTHRRALVNAKVTLRIEDGDLERVHTAELTSSRFGVIHQDWTIPSSAALGQYRIFLITGKDDSYPIGQHVVRVSRYDLPNFQVSVKPDRSAYLPSQPAKVTINGRYLFDKAVPRGKVKLTRDEITVAEGQADTDGSFLAQLDLTKDHADLRDRDSKYEDLHYAVYYTDPGSGKTEQRKFDIRISAEPIHIYILRQEEGGSLPGALYVSTSYADGTPASALVEIIAGSQSSTLRTNKYGIGKVLVNLESTTIGVKATDAQGLTGTLREFTSPGTRVLRMESDKTIHRAGESVTLRIISPPDHPSVEFLMIHAHSDSGIVAQRVVRLQDHRGEVTFPYQPEFRRRIVFSAWNGVDPRVGSQPVEVGFRAVIFPDGSDLQVSARTDRAVYRPGEKATLRMEVLAANGKPQEASLGLAIVDQSVLERARTDNEFGARPWFSCAFCNDGGETELGGIRLNDLYLLKPSQPISPELDLVAEALVSNSLLVVHTDQSESILTSPGFKSMVSQMTQLRTRLESQYSQTLEFPRGSGLAADMLDPWGSSYRAEFSVRGPANVLTFHSSGPDKLARTLDDIAIGEFSKPYFTPVRMLIDQALKQQQDYPATLAEFKDALAKNGILLDALHDPWNTPYRAVVSTYRNTRQIRINSAGPDRIMDTTDDVEVAWLQGRYFVKESLQIMRAILGESRPPQNEEGFQLAMARSGVDISTYRDDWNHAYRLSSIVTSRFENRNEGTTVQTFGQPSLPRTTVTPVTRKYITFDLKSSGPDGVADTYDDFSVAQFPVLLGEESQAEVAVRSAAMGVGTGAISGLVTDASGAAVANARIALLKAGGEIAGAQSDERGVYQFLSVPEGVYSIRVGSPGFMIHLTEGIPVVSGKATMADVELRVGSVSEAVEVNAGLALFQTQAATVSGFSATPRVRDYFPETLLWLPEVITDRTGKASAEFQLADSVTNWKIAAFASTTDGRFAQAESDFRSFQPFFIEFNPPAVLTEGDQLDLPVTIRNYQSSSANVVVDYLKNGWSTMVGPARQSLTVPANSSANATLQLKASVPSDKALQRISATSGRNGDAIEKSLRVHPDGQEIVRTFGEVISGRTNLSVSIPMAAISGATKAELRLYPNIASMLLESAAAILRTPHGCAEQTISSGYANLIALRFADAAGTPDPRIRAKALANIRLARDGIDAFQSFDGSVSYWSSGKPNTAVTALALHFFVDAKEVAPGDKDDLSKLVVWLERSQQKDGTWVATDREDSVGGQQNVLLTATVARSLAAAKRAGVAVKDETLAAAYHHIARSTDAFGEPYVLAQFILAAIDSGHESLLLDAVPRLLAAAHKERGGMYWDLRSNSPFYGWGTAGRLETTGMVVSALSAWRAKHPESGLDQAIRGGLVFLINSRDRWGGWYSTQASVRTMRAIADAAPLLGLSTTGGNLEIRSNGRLLKTVAIPSSPAAADPILLDVSAALSSAENTLEFIPDRSLPLSLMRLTTSHWIPWERTQPRASTELRFAVQCEQAESRCTVKAERVGFKGYGMMLAEIGLPPGSDVDRDSLESVLNEVSGVDRYEVLPDKVIFYLWPQAGGVSFDFKLNARIPMVAKSAVSVLYDYYNPEALAEVAPVVWTVKP
jgi:hypothetical protein